VNGFMDHLLPEQVDAYQRGLWDKIIRECPELVHDMIVKKDLTDEIKGRLHEQLNAYGRGAI
jgi:hypothetical protein